MTARAGRLAQSDVVQLAGDLARGLYAALAILFEASLDEPRLGGRRIGSDFTERSG